ncbi:hypothetical protein BX600DRAFT_509433 [Xylariales sp. PMI_506]|nr:hypothetical protein BX600DRAFT_509433 [Xylariales sp. PMI_506]
MSLAATGKAVVAADTSSLASRASNITLLAGVPDCALPCASVISAAGCFLKENTTLLTGCLCANVSIQSSYSTCVQSHCPQLLDQSREFTRTAVTNVDIWLMVPPAVTFDVENQICEGYPVESRANVGIVTAIVTISIGVPIVLARCVTRFKLTGRLWSDDYMSIFTLAMVLVMAGTQLWSSHRGLGQHYWTIDLNNFPFIRLMFYVSKLLYVVVQCTGKVAILMVYQRIFDSNHVSRWFRRTIKVLISLTFLIEGIYIFIIAFQCIPISAQWDSSVTNARCLNLDVAFTLAAVINIVSDLVLMILPIPELRKLQVSRKKKWGVALMFIIASFKPYSNQISHRRRIRYYVDLFSWSIIELLCVVVCGSIPALRLLVVFSIKTATSSMSSKRQQPAVDTKNSDYSRATSSNHFSKRFSSATVFSAPSKHTSDILSRVQSVRSVDTTTAKIVNGQSWRGISPEPRSPSPAWIRPYSPIPHASNMVGRAILEPGTLLENGSNSTTTSSNSSSEIDLIIMGVPDSNP